MILQSQTQSHQGFGGKAIEPIDRKDYKVWDNIDLAPFNMRVMTMRLEYMSKWYQHHREISRCINPKRGFFEGYIPNWNAQIDHRFIIDGTPQKCVRTLAAGMQSGLTTPSRPWFTFGLEDQDLEKFGPVQAWLELVRDRMMRVFSRSNVYLALHQTYEELGMFGTGGFGLYEDFRSVMRARSYTIGEYHLANDPTGRVNAYARLLWKTVDNVVNEFGWKNCSAKVQHSYKSGQRDTFVMLYELCEENTTKIEGRFDFKGKKFRQVTFELDSQENKVVQMGGYNEFPGVFGRWDMTTTADTYGIGPGWYGLGDTKSLYRLKKDILLGVNKMVDPPVIVSGSVQGQTNMNPGGITRSSSQTQNPGAQPAYQVDPKIKEGMELFLSFKEDLREWFYTDLFSAMLSAPDEATQKTAAEIAARHEEKLLLLGPVLERVFTEVFDPTIERAFAIMLRAGLIPPPPPEIAGMNITPRYISLLAQAMQQVSSTANEKLLAFVGNAVAIDANAVDVIDIDEIVREQRSALGASAKTERSPEAVAEIRKQKQAAAAKAEAQRDLMAATVAAKNLGGTPLGGGNALEHVTGVPPGEGRA